MSARNGLLLLALAAGAIVPAAAQDVAIVGARVVPGPDAGVIERGTVVVREGRIAAVGAVDEVEVPPAVAVVDGSGGTLVAGFWNSHVHFMAPRMLDPATPAVELQAELDGMLNRWGFTTVFDVAALEGVAAALRARIDGGIRGPEILSVDVPFFPEHGTPVYVRDLFESLDAPSAEVAGPDEARARAARQLEAGADGVKLFAGAIVGGDGDVLPMRVDIASAVVAEAHRRGKPAFAHPSNVAGLEVALASGVDILAHTTPASGPWDDAMVRRLHAAGIALVPTLTLFDHALRADDAPAEVVERFLSAARQQVQALHEAGGEILFGTDVGYIDEADTRREFELLAQAGLDWREILAALTTRPAARFGQAADKGRIEPGMRGDLVLLEGDPAADATAFGRVARTFRGGREQYPGSP